jgi:predicted PurR-regulated permease PerM/ribosomal protein S18 acetylase RimI-like enzyme
MDTSPRWSANTKLVVMLGILAVIGFLFGRFQVLIMPLIMSVILAYLLNPIVTVMTRTLRLSRTLAVLILDGVLILLLVGLISGAGLLLQQQMSGVLATVLAFINSIPAWLDSVSANPVTIGPFTFSLATIDATLLQDVLLPTARDWVSQITGWMTGAASGIATFVGLSAFAFIVAFYLLHDMDAMQKGFIRLVPQEYKKDARRLLVELSPIWNAFLRGQLLLSLIMGIAVGSAMAILGLRYSLILGLMAGLAEFVPVLGANVLSVTVILVAMFQPSNWLGLTPTAFALVAWLTGGVLQQLEANFLIPRIMGSQLKMHPAILIVGALVGFSLMGLPGLLLSAPILATARLFGRYMYAKLFNLPPWPDRVEPALFEGKPAVVRLRPARDSDKRAMLELTAQMWEGRDYIPEVWSEWLADRRGILVAAEADGRMVGFGKLSRLGPKEWWLEGLRVHPEYQGVRIGSQLTEHLLAQWKRRGGGVIRLATSSERLQIHHLCGRLGFRRVDIRRLMAAPPAVLGGNEFVPMVKAEAKEAAGFWKSRAAAWKTPALVNDNWRWSRFSEEHLASVIRRGRAWWWRDRSAILLAYDSNREGKPGLEVASLLAPPDKLTAILRQLRVLARAQSAGRVVWVMPDDPRRTDAARRAGFTQTWNARLWIFEHSDSPAA